MTRYERGKPVIGGYMN